MTGRAERLECLQLQALCSAKARAAVAAGDLDAAQAWLEAAAEMDRQYRALQEGVSPSGSA